MKALILAVAYWAAPALAQESEVPSTRDIGARLQQQLEKNDQRLRAMFGNTDASLATSLGNLDSLTAIEAPRSRGLDDMGAVPDFFRVDFLLTQDHTYRIVDANNSPGFVLTGKWISDYAKKSRLVPALEQALAGYRTQSELNNQLLGEMEAALGIKDQKIDVMQEMNQTLKERGDLYKAKSEILQDPWFKKLFRSLSYPLGFTAGVFVGVVLSNNVN